MWYWQLFRALELFIAVLVLIDRLVLILKACCGCGIYGFYVMYLELCALWVSWCGFGFMWVVCFLWVCVDCCGMRVWVDDDVLGLSMLVFCGLLVDWCVYCLCRDWFGSAFGGELGFCEFCMAVVR